jgi:hypothetical protein
VDLTYSRSTPYTVRFYTVPVIRNRPYTCFRWGTDVVPTRHSAGRTQVRLVFDRERIGEHARRDEH